MSSKRANQLEQTLERAARGETVEGPLEPLIHTAQRLSTLGNPPPPPPYKLAPGRQRLLAHYAATRERKSKAKSRVRPLAGALRPASVLTVAVLVLSLLLGAGQAMADSLPGEPLYGLKLLVTEQRMRWTNDPHARMDLALNAVGERLNEIAVTIETGQDIDPSTNSRLQKHLGWALDAVDQETQGPLQAMEQQQVRIQSWHRRVVQAMAEFPESDREPLRELARETERLRLELHAGSGEPEGEQFRARHGEPKEPADMPQPGERTGPGPQAEQSVPANGMPAGPGPKPEETPTGAEAPASAGPGPGPQAPEETSGSGPTQTQTGPSGPSTGGGQQSGGSDTSGGTQPHDSGGGSKSKP
jgi:uncharacterized membrane protein YgcG